MLVSRLCLESFFDEVSNFNSFFRLCFANNLVTSYNLILIVDFRDHEHIIRKVKFLSENSILTKPQHFHEFFTQIFFLTIFLVKSKLSTAKKPKTTTFSRVFHPKKFDNFLRKSKLNFWTKNEDFEQFD